MNLILVYCMCFDLVLTFWLDCIIQNKIHLNQIWLNVTKYKVILFVFQNALRRYALWINAKQNTWHEKLLLFRVSAHP